MNENLVSQLVEMGFPINASKRGAYFSGGDLEAAMNWLCSHIDDPDYNTGKLFLPSHCRDMNEFDMN